MRMPPAARNLFINTLQKFGKKTKLFFIPVVFVSYDTLIGCGRRPLFEKRFLDFQKLFIKKKPPWPPKVK